MLMSASDTIKRIRINLCLEQKDFAQKIGVTVAAISNYERGIRRPRLPIIKKLKELADENNIPVKIEDFLD